MFKKYDFDFSDLSNNDITVLPPYVFANLTRLSTLIVSYNKLQCVQVIIEKQKNNFPTKKRIFCFILGACVLRPRQPPHPLPPRERDFPDPGGRVRRQVVRHAPVNIFSFLTYRYFLHKLFLFSKVPLVLTRSTATAPCGGSQPGSRGTTSSRGSPGAGQGEER